MPDASECEAFRPCCDILAASISRGGRSVVEAACVALAGTRGSIGGVTVLAPVGMLVCCTGEIVGPARVFSSSAVLSGPAVRFWFPWVDANRISSDLDGRSG